MHQMDMYLAAGFKWVTIDALPVIKHALREGLSLSETSEMGCETEGFSDWKIGSDL